jgi:hypothetical protein
MTVSAATPSITYAANGVATVYAYPFKTFLSSHIVATLDGATVTNYTVSGLGDDVGGNLTFSPAPLGELVIRRVLPLSRSTDYQAGGAFREDQVDQDQDIQTQQIQQIAEESRRSLKLSPGNAAPANLDPTPNTFPAFDASGALVNAVLQTGTSLVDLASSIGSALVGFIQAGVGAVFRPVQDKLRETVSVKDFGAAGDGVTDDSAAIQAAIDYLATLFCGTLFFPDGRYLINTAVTIKNHITISGVGTGTNGVAAKGSYLIANNATACFTAASVQKIKFENIGFRAQGAGVGVAYAYKQTNLATYTSRAEFYDCDFWADLAGGFYGNFILTTWRRCQFGYLGSAGAQFLPIYSKGDIAGNQTNANLIEDCYVLKSKGVATIYFEAGTDLTLRNVRFEQCAADSLLNCAGVYAVNCDSIYIEASFGAGCLYPLIFQNDTTNAQGCASISINNSYISLVSPNTHLIRHLGSSGNIDFNNNVVFNLAGRNLTSSASGTNKGFGSYLGNRTDGFTLKRENIFTYEGTWTPAIKSTSGTQAHTNGVQYGEYKRSGNYVTAMFKVSITAKDAGATGFAYIDMGTLPTVDSTKATAIEGFAGALYYYSGVTQAAGRTQLGISVEATGKIVISGSGSAVAPGQHPISGVAAATTFVGQVTYITSDA